MYIGTCESPCIHIFTYKLASLSTVRDLKSVLGSP